MSKPELVVRLKPDAAGAPAFTPGKGRTHYHVEFEIKNPPPDTYAATFQLDPSYANAVRTLPPHRDGSFRLSTTTYGDYPFAIRLHTRKGGEVNIIDTVARALRRGGAASPAYQAAIDAIAAN